MNKAEKFIYELEALNTNLNVFLKLFNMWDRMSVKERVEVIENKMQSFNRGGKYDNNYDKNRI